MPTKRPPSPRTITVQLRVDLEIDSAQNIWPQVREYFAAKLGEEVVVKDLTVVTGDK